MHGCFFPRVAWPIGEIRIAMFIPLWIIVGGAKGNKIKTICLIFFKSFIRLKVKLNHVRESMLWTVVVSSPYIIFRPV